ncbi:MAG: glutathione S-transferase C-terminal domain-containing protein [Alphaproteobacteria bacterium]
MERMDAMPGYGLIIGDKHLSSWSLRAWLLLRHFDLAFQEQVVRLNQPDTRQNIPKYFPAARVPGLLTGDQAIWENPATSSSLPSSTRTSRSSPRSHTKGPGPCHGGGNEFRVHALREEMPFELQMHAPHGKLRRAGEDDIDRICDIWRQGRRQFGARGKFLFGDFSAADVMYAPVAVRFKHYGIALDDVCQGYVEAVFARPPLQEWLAAVALETPTSG